MHELWKRLVVDHLGRAAKYFFKDLFLLSRVLRWIRNSGSNWIVWLFLSGYDKTMVFLIFGSVSVDIVSGWSKAAYTYFLFSMDEIIFGSI